jgi:transcription initiation factor TFIIIB Brf1 subunit/transcription initiation factor TFIIB
VDPQTGKIAWPPMLRDDGFRESREAVESALARCSAGAGGVEREKLAQAARSLLEQLKSHVEAATPSEYVAARQFLKTLALEAKSPAGLK